MQTSRRRSQVPPAGTASARSFRCCRTSGPACQRTQPESECSGAAHRGSALKLDDMSGRAAPAHGARGPLSARSRLCQRSPAGIEKQIDKLAARSKRWPARRLRLSRTSRSWNLRIEDMIGHLAASSRMSGRNRSPDAGPPEAGPHADRGMIAIWPAIRGIVPAETVAHDRQDLQKLDLTPIEDMIADLASKFEESSGPKPKPRPEGLNVRSRARGRLDISRGDVANDGLERTCRPDALARRLRDERQRRRPRGARRRGRSNGPLPGSGRNHADLSGLRDDLADSRMCISRSTGAPSARSGGDDTLEKMVQRLAQLETNAARARTVSPPRLQAARASSPRSQLRSLSTPPHPHPPPPHPHRSCALRRAERGQSDSLTAESAQRIEARVAEDLRAPRAAHAASRIAPAEAARAEAARAEATAPGRAARAATRASGCLRRKQCSIRLTLPDMPLSPLRRPRGRSDAGPPRRHRLMASIPADRRRRRPPWPPARG